MTEFNPSEKIMSRTIHIFTCWFKKKETIHETNKTKGIEKSLYFTDETRMPFCVSGFLENSIEVAPDKPKSNTENTTSATE